MSIPYGKQNISASDISAVVEALSSDWLTTGPRVEEFEEEISNVTGKGAVVVSSGTAALHAAYYAAGIKDGDEVITPPNTFIATQAMVEILGAKVVFCDVDIETGLLDPKLLPNLITERTKAVVTVDYAGQPSSLNEIREVIKDSNIVLIEDAAHSIGSKYFERNVGEIADITTFSFFPTKNITTGEGGAVCALDSSVLSRARTFARQGLIRDPENFILEPHGPWHQEVHEFGLNYRLPDILCALGITQIKKIQHFKQVRQEIFIQYQELLNSFPLVKTPKINLGSDPMWHLFPIRVPKEKRKQLYSALHLNGIKAQVNYFPAHLHPVYARKGFKRGDFPNAESFYEAEISLPMFADRNILNPEYFNQLEKVLYDFFNSSAHNG
jgi:dTDP-4-amino-4,6-dideoxygalactose transaminase